MKNHLIAAITAGAIATFGLSSAPAQAGPNEELARFLVGAVAIGILIDAANKSKAQPVPMTRRAPPPPRRRMVRVYEGKPRACLAERWTDRYGWVKFYRPRCMRRHGWQRDVGPWYKRVAVWR